MPTLALSPARHPVQVGDEVEEFAPSEVGMYEWILIEITKACFREQRLLDSKLQKSTRRMPCSLTIYLPVTARLVKWDFFYCIPIEAVP